MILEEGGLVVSAMSEIVEVIRWCIMDKLRENMDTVFTAQNSSLQILNRLQFSSESLHGILPSISCPLQLDSHSIANLANPKKDYHNISPDNAPVLPFLYRPVRSLFLPQGTLRPGKTTPKNLHKQSSKWPQVYVNRNV